MNIRELTSIIRNNKDTIKKAYTILDSTTALALLGASIDEDARKHLLTGVIVSLVSSVALGGVILTGIGGPVLLGVEVVSTMAKAGLVTGTISIIKGLVKGFSSGIEQSKLTAKAVENVVN